ncbi:hypothetical protein E1292_26295 [Nonomuraea deserti]|uniref:DUF6603 domain-containing protein n=1 Tax=Nonomuraea deserti TaxID=1848322 RepID=A0A4V2Y9V7_9ACTN|nr:DUF6603 domain-containing protein [Nonomuraea deserti]TDD01326.1 hypothetical protein E1292_26295 [Nonomuraea deserti]
MAGSVRRYADNVITGTGLEGDPQAVELRAAADALDAALSAPAVLDGAVARWRAAIGATRDRLMAYLLTGVPAPLPASRDWAAPDGVHFAAGLGPFALHLTCPHLTLPDPRDPAAAAIVVGPLPPKSIGVRLDLGGGGGSGVLEMFPDGARGVLGLDLGIVEAAALMSLRRAGAGPSVAAVLSAGFTPGLQLGFGFQLSRVGGVVGADRSVDPQKLAGRLRDGSAGQVLFPLDLGDSARRALVALEEILPARSGASVVGPTLRLSWLEIAGQGFCSLDVAVLMELPGPQRVVVVGIARAGIKPVLRLRVDVAGAIDLAQSTVAVDASLIDSGLLGVFSVYGDVAFRQCWGPRAHTVLTAGGFYPGYRPEPATIPALNRLGYHLDVPVPGISLRAEGYLAITSNSVQLGGRLEVGIRAAGCGAHGFLSVDSIVQFTPFHVHAEVSAGFEVKVFGVTFCGVRLDGTLDGPGPLTLRGRLTVETFLEDFDFDATFTFGSSSGGPVQAGPQRAAEVLKEEVRPQALRAVGGHDPDVVPAQLPVPAGLALISPRGGVCWEQHRVPLTVPIDRLDGAPLGGVQTVTVTAPHLTAITQDLFAPGSFIMLTQAEALNRPAFESLPAGIVCSGGEDLTGPVTAQPGGHTVLRKVRGEGLLPLATIDILTLPGIVQSMLTGRDDSPAATNVDPLVSLVDEPWVATHDGAVHGSATAAHQMSRISGGFAVAEADLAVPVALEDL